jgi:hypothetical protein
VETRVPVSDRTARALDSAAVTLYVTRDDAEAKKETATVH